MINFFSFFKQNLTFEKNLKLCQIIIQNITQNTTKRVILSLKVLQ